MNPARTSFTLAPWIKPSATLAATACVIAAGTFGGPSTLILTLAGCALLLGLGAFWSSLSSITGDAPLDRADVLALAAPAAELERKQSVLRALRDLEFELSVGKISRPDFDHLSAQYRHEAKELLRQIEVSSARSHERAEALVKLRQKPEPHHEPVAPQGPLDCPDCKSPNDHDAVFCKKCGKRLEHA